MAHKKAGGSSRNGRDTAGRRLGLKKFGGEAVIPGNIIARQRGTKWHPGENVGIGRDHTLFALTGGHVRFAKRSRRQDSRFGRAGGLGSPTSVRPAAGAHRALGARHAVSRSGQDSCAERRRRRRLRQLSARQE